MAASDDSTDWSYADCGIAVDASYGEVHADAWRRLGECGTWWTGAERVAILAEARAAARCGLCATRREAVSPNAVTGEHDTAEAGALLPSTAVDAVHRIATDPGRITRGWVQETRYAIDGFADALGALPRALPTPGAGEPTRVRPGGVGNVGAYVSQSTDKAFANVSRAASLVPDTADIWRAVVTQQYSRGPEMLELVWDRPLERPQVELVAATVSALNECFY
jgi:hypothetical protein